MAISQENLNRVPLDGVGALLGIEGHFSGYESPETGPKEFQPRTKSSTQVGSRSSLVGSKPLENFRKWRFWNGY